MPQHGPVGGCLMEPRLLIPVHEHLSLEPALDYVTTGFPGAHITILVIVPEAAGHRTALSSHTTVEDAEVLAQAPDDLFASVQEAISDVDGEIVIDQASGALTDALADHVSTTHSDLIVAGLPSRSHPEFQHIKQSLESLSAATATSHTFVYQ